MAFLKVNKNKLNLDYENFDIKKLTLNIENYKKLYPIYKYYVENQFEYDIFKTFVNDQRLTEEENKNKLKSVIFELSKIELGIGIRYYDKIEIKLPKLKKEKEQLLKDIYDLESKDYLKMFDYEKDLQDFIHNFYALLYEHNRYEVLEFDVNIDLELHMNLVEPIVIDRIEQLKIKCKNSYDNFLRNTINSKKNVLKVIKYCDRFKNIIEDFMREVELDFKMEEL